MMKRSRFAVALALGFTTGCAGLAHDVARGAVPGAFEGAIDAGTDRNNQQRLVDGIDPKIVTEASAKIVSGVIDGTLQSLSEPERRRQLGESLGAATKGFELPLRIDGINRSSIGDIVDEAMSRLMTPLNGIMARAGIRLVIKDVVAAAFDEARDQFDADAFNKALAQGARNMAKEATLGFQDAIDENARRKRSGQLDTDEGNVLDAADKAARTGWGIIPIVVGASIGFAIALLAGAIWSGKRSRRNRVDLARRDEALLAVVDVMNAARDKPWSAELNEILKDTMHDRENVDHLRQLLGRQRQSQSPLVNGLGSKTSASHHA